MELERLWRWMGRAICDFRLIEDGDSVAVGLSGGKDSLLMTYALARFKRVAPVRFDLAAITIDGGFAGAGAGADAGMGMDAGGLPPDDGLTGFCESLGVRHVRHFVPIWEAVREQGLEENPCSLCSRLRHGALHRIAAGMGCEKVALAHHADDAVETLLMNILLNGRVDCFRPTTKLSRSGVTLIRPMVYVPEAAIRSLVRELGLPVVANPCPVDGKTMRQRVKGLLDTIVETVPNARESALAALAGEGGPWGTERCRPDD